MNEIKIQNMTNRTIELHAPHQVVCVALGRCLCAREGGCAVIRLLPHSQQGATKLVPGEWEKAPDVISAVKRGDCKIHKKTNNTEQPQAPKSATATARKRRGAKE